MENEERKQEDVMKRFRSRDCNILVATNVLEDGIDLPATWSSVLICPNRTGPTFTPKREPELGIPISFLWLNTRG